MSFSVIVTKTSSFTDSNIPPSLDPLNDITSEDPAAAPYYMPTTYNGFNSEGTFSVVVKFGEEGAEQTLNPTFILPQSIKLGLSATVTQNTFTISGKADDDFAGSYYEFAMKDKSFKKLPPDNTEDFYALIRYKMPEPTFIEEEHVITIGIPQDPILSSPQTTFSLIIKQWCLWYYYPVFGLVQLLSPPRI